LIATAIPPVQSGQNLFTGLPFPHQLPLVDARVIVKPKGNDVIKARLSQPWKHRFRMRDEGFYANPAPRTDRSAPMNPEDLFERHLGPHAIKHAVLMPKARVSENHDPDYSTAVAAAYNDWLAETWLDHKNEGFKLFGSITIAHQDPNAAAREIRRSRDGLRLPRSFRPEAIQSDL
jgi:uncharacterized protein